MALSPRVKKGLTIACGIIGGFEAITHIITTIELGIIGAIGYAFFQLFGSEKSKLTFKDMIRRMKENITR